MTIQHITPGTGKFSAMLGGQFVASSPKAIVTRSIKSAMYAGTALLSVLLTSYPTMAGDGDGGASGASWVESPFGSFNSPGGDPGTSSVTSRGEDAPFGSKGGGGSGVIGGNGNRGADAGSIGGQTPGASGESGQSEGNTTILSGAGGGGAHGYYGTWTNSAVGGNGGSGSDAKGIGGAGGGGGGFGAVVTSSGLNTLTGTIRGGNGGAGGNTRFFDDGEFQRYGGAGNGGSGGTGLYFVNNSTVIIQGIVAGGNAGAAGVGLDSSSPNGTAGTAGRGIVGAGTLDITFSGAGQISGGLNVGGSYANALVFLGVNNRLTLTATAGVSAPSGRINGNVIGGAGTDTLILGGTVNGSFNLSEIGGSQKYQSFESFDKTGTSLWTVTGTNSTIAGRVSAGTLVLGSGSTAGTFTGAMTVANGGILSGNTTGTVVGRVNGAVTVQNGGAIAARQTTVVGNLTTGNLILNNTSLLSMTLGAPSTTAAVAVTGNLTLDGVLNVTEASANAMQVGTYRLINYTGTLTNNILTVNSITSPSRFLYQVDVNTVAKTVNLDVLPADLYWNGTVMAGGGPFGGNGAWNLTNTNWVQSGGQNSQTWPSANAFFSGAAGIVSLDTSTSAMSLTFLVDGYRITPASASNTLTLTDPAGVSLVTVNTGTARIDANVVVTAGMTKAGSGTLILTGTNSYTGGTSVTGGVLQVGSAADGVLGTLTGSVVMSNGTTLRFDQNGNYSFAGVVSNAVSATTGKLEKSGTGTLTLSGANSYSGGTTISGGAVQVIDGGALGSGAIVNNASLVINRSTALALANAISGTGSLTKQGTGTLTLSGANSYSGITTVSGGVLQVNDGAAFGTGGIVNDASLVFNRSNNLALANVISGTGALTKQGTGTLTLMGTNIFGGLTTISGGTLALADDGSIAGSSGVAVDSGAMFSIAGLTSAGTTIQSLSGAGTAALGSRTLTILNGGTFAGNFTGDGVVVAGAATGAQTTVLTGDSAAFAGIVQLGAGDVLQLGTGGATGSVGTANVELTGAASVLDVQRLGDITLAGVISGVGSVTVGATSNLILTGMNSFTGGVTVAGTVGSGAQLQIGNGAVGGGGELVSDVSLSDALDRLVFQRAGRVTYAGTVSGAGFVRQAGAGTTVVTGALQHVGGTQVLAGNLEIGDGGTTGTVSGAVAVSAGAQLGFNRSDAVVLNAVSGAGSVAQLGTGTLTVFAAQAYTGATFVQAGRLVLSGAGDISQSSGVDVSAAAIFDIAGVSGAQSSVQALTGEATGEVVLGGKTLLVSAASGTFGGAITGTGGLTVSGGTQTLSGINSFGGATTVSSGATLALTGTGSLATSSSVNTAGAFDISGTIAGASIRSLSGASTGTVALGSQTLTLSAAADTFAGIISGAGGLTVGGGTQTLSGINSFGGATAISSGATLALTGTGSLATSSSVNTAGAFDISGTIAGASIRSLSGASTGTVALGSQRLTLSAAADSFAGRISGAGGISVGSGTQVLSGANDFTGQAIIDAGAVLQLGAGGTSGSMVADAQVDGTLRFDYAARNDVGNQPIPYVYGGIISGAGAVEVDGAGTVSLTGNSSTFTGITTVSAGGLRVNGQLGGNIAVQAGAMLGGSGTIGGSVSFAGGRLEAGNSPGTLTISGDLTLDAATVSRFELNSPGIIGGANNDLVVVDGALTLGGALEVDADMAGLYRLFNAGSVASGTDFASRTVKAGLMAGATATTYQVVDSVGGFTQVNLVIVGTGQTAQFWDGTDTTGDGSITGGNGTWNSSLTSWTQDPAFQVNGSWAGSVGIFDVVGGTVDVVGAQAFDTLQFKVDGYVLNPGAGALLTLEGAGLIDVDNDNSLTPASTTIGVVIADGAQDRLTKRGADRLILTANNSYTGGTVIDAGTLQIGNGGTSGAILNDVVNNGVLVFDRSDAITFNGVVSGTGAVTQQGASALTLTAANSYTGATVVATGGSLALSGAGSIAASSSVDIAGGFDISATAAGASIRSLSGSAGGAVLLGARTLTLSAAADTFAGTISGAGGLTIAGGTQTLSGVNSYGGVTRIDTGATLSLVAAGAVSQSSSLDVAGIFDISAATGGATINALTDGAAGTVMLGAADLSISNASGGFGGRITGTGGLNLLGGVQTLFGLNDYTGSTQIGSTAELVVSGGSFVSDVGVAGTLSFARSDDWTYGGVLSGNGALQQGGAGTVTLTGNSSGFAGTTAINAGMLRVNGQLGGNVVAAAGGTLGGSGTLGGNVTVQAGGALTGGSTGTLSITGNAAFDTGSRAIFAFGEAGVVGGTANDHIAVGGALTIGSGSTVDVAIDTTNGGNGLGFYRLFTAGTATGLFDTVNLTIDGAATSATATLYNNAPGTAVQVNLAVLGAGQILQFWDGTDTLGDGSLTPGSGVWSSTSTNWSATQTSANINAPWVGSVGVFEAPGGTITVEGAQAFDMLQFNGNGYTLQAGTGGVLSLAGSSGGATVNVQSGLTTIFEVALANGSVNDFVKAQGGTLVLSGTNSYTGTTTIAGGTLALSGTGSIASSSGVIANGIFDIAATQAGASITSLSGSGAVALGARTLTLSNASGTFSGGLSGNGGGLIVAGGTQILTGAASHTGQTAILAGATLQLGNGAGAGPFAGNIANDGVLAFNHGSALDYQGVVSGSGALVKSGTGRLSLSGSSAGFNGATTVAGGTLAINGELGGSLTVQAGATLAGSGTARGDVGILSGATLSAGNSPGTLTIGGSLTLANGSVSLFELGQSGIVGGSSNDLVRVAGALNVAGALDARASSAGFYRLFSAGSITGGFDSVSATINGAAANGTVYANMPGAAEQVNIVILNDGQVLQFWDGTDTIGDGVVQGGAGTWDNSSTNWTGAPGTAEVNGAWVRSVGVFDATGGAVNVVGTQSFDTLQFNVGGYVLNPASGGGALAIGAPGGSTVNVAANQTATFTLPVVNGAGSGFTKTGDGTLILVADNSYTGGTTIGDGTLQLGNGGTTGSVIGNIANNGTLIINRSNDVTMPGTISGTGSLVQAGTGTTVLTGNNTYTGGTNINAGELQIGAGGTTGSITGNINIAGPGTLSIDRSDNWTFIADITGTGNLVHAGPGTTTLRGNGCGFAGTTTIANGHLVIEGCMGGDIIVDNGGTIDGGGNGGGSGGGTTIGPVVINNGGTISPGGSNGIGTITVNGTLTINRGAIYMVNVNAAGQSDLISVTGAAIINGGTVQAIAAPGNYQPLTRYTILTAQGGLTLGGQNRGFDSVTSSLAFLTPFLSYDANNVYLTMTRNDIDFEDIATTPNTRGVAGAVQSMGPGNPIYDAIVVLDKDAANDAYNQLSGEAYASAQAVMLDDSQFVRSAVLQRAGAAFGSPAVASGNIPLLAFGNDGVRAVSASDPLPESAFWGTAFGSRAERNSDGNAAQSQRDLGGLLVGIDGAAFDNWRFGAFGGYATANLNVGARHSTLDVESYHLGLYGAAQWGNLGLRLGSAYTWSSLESRRQIAFPGFADALDADYNAATAQIFGELGYRIDVNEAVVEPFAGLAYVHTDTDGFTENGGAAALTAKGQNNDMAYTTLGLRTSRETTLDNGMTITPHAMLAWRHAFGDTSPATTFQFASGSTPFTTTPTAMTRDAAIIEAGVKAQLTTDLTLDLVYSGTVTKKSTDNAINLNLNWKF